MGIETYGSMVFSSMKQILNDVHDTDVSVVTLLRPDHFMPWVHPFTSVISGPTGSGKSVFVRRFVHNIKHMIPLSAAATAVVAYIPLSAAAAAYIPLSAADTHHCSVDTDELFHAYFFYVST
jgi:hypothetical protein